jgi:hypothetical protein
MTTNEKIEELKKYYDDSKFKSFFTEDCENVTQIIFEDNIVYYYTYSTASCGCCSEMLDKEIDLDRFITFLSDSDYQCLLDELKGA